VLGTTRIVALVVEEEESHPVVARDAAHGDAGDRLVSRLVPDDELPSRPVVQDGDRAVRVRDVLGRERAVAAGVAVASRDEADPEHAGESTHAGLPFPWRQNGASTSLMTIPGLM
jgi:hypothetical protein